MNASVSGHQRDALRLCLTHGRLTEVFRRAPSNGWHPVTTPYAIDEVMRHLPDLPISATADWASIRGQLVIMDDILTLSLPVVFPIPKDKPILFGALAWADFHSLLGREVYGLAILTPGQFLERERAIGRLV